MVMHKIRESPLTTSDPYHLPRYLGYCPQLKFQIGNTFGQTTHNLLTDKNVATSGQSVLANIDMTPRVQPDKYNAPGTEESIKSIENRIRSFGDRKYQTHMVPGYTGFIPRGQHQLGKRYGQHCVSSIADFIHHQDKRERYQAALNKDRTPCRAPQRGIYTADEMKLFISKDQPPYPISPYKMSNENKHKYFMSGYTGFCPRSRPVHGMGYPEVTREALKTFTNEQHVQKQLEGKATQIQRPPPPCMPSPVIYPESSGMVPRYTGYIPGEKFRFGHTYGNNTTASLQKTGLRPCQTA